MLLCLAGGYSPHDDDDKNIRIQRRHSRFFTISSLGRELSPTRTLKWPRHNRVKITCCTSSAYHVQRVVCHWVRRDSSAIEFDRAEIAFILALLYWLKPSVSRLRRLRRAALKLLLGVQPLLGCGTRDVQSAAALCPVWGPPAHPPPLPPPPPPHHLLHRER